MSGGPPIAMGLGESGAVGILQAMRCKSTVMQDLSVCDAPRQGAKTDVPRQTCDL